MSRWLGAGGAAPVVAQCRRPPRVVRGAAPLLACVSFYGSAVWPSGWLRRTAAQLARGRLPRAGSALPLAVLAADGPICQFGRAVYYWHAPCTSREGHGFATMDSSVQISISGKKIVEPLFPFTVLPAHPTKQPYPPTAPTRWLELNYERNCNPQSSHTTYLQAISVVTASKSSTVYVSVQGKSAADDLSYFKSTQTHTVSYMKNKIPHIDVFLTEQDFKNNEI
uniref:Uncharacterized protein n=1 Tax=Oryza meridionalis TaxID=40149 RepID=A0A0E0E9Y4_9ORYZ